jgi:hypothetical protein
MGWWPMSDAQSQAQPKENHKAHKASNQSPKAGAVGRLMPVNRIVGKAVIGHVDLLTLAH